MALQDPDTMRITPAPAGSTPPTSSAATPTRDHPRACGEHQKKFVTSARFVGSPPRLRGARHLAHQLAAVGRITPAPAGSTARGGSSSCLARDHPRACGEHGIIA